MLYGLEISTKTVTIRKHLHYKCVFNLNPIQLLLAFCFTASALTSLNNLWQSPTRCDSTASSQSSLPAFLVMAVPRRSSCQEYSSCTLSACWPCWWNPEECCEGHCHGGSSSPSDPSGSSPGLETWTVDSTELLGRWELCWFGPGAQETLGSRPAASSRWLCPRRDTVINSKKKKKRERSVIWAISKADVGSWLLSLEEQHFSTHRGGSGSNCKYVYQIWSVTINYLLAHDTTGLETSQNFK